MNGDGLPTNHVQREDISMMSDDEAVQGQTEEALLNTIHIYTYW